MNFSNEELYMLSEGILLLIRDANGAAALLHDANLIKEVEDLRSKYVELNAKICDMISDNSEE